MRRFTFNTLALTAALFAPAAAHAICDDGCNESFGDSDDFGNSKFGVGYSFDVTLKDKAGYLSEQLALIEEYEELIDDAPALIDFALELVLEELIEDYEAEAAGIADDYLAASASADVEATVFGTDKSILAVGADAIFADGGFEAGLSASVLGGSVDMPSLTTTERDLFLVEKTFFKAKTTYMAGPFPVTVRGEVTGSVSAVGSLNAANGVAIGVTPNANLSASADISVGAACLRAGVRGELTLINVDVPTTVGLSSTACGFDVTLDSFVNMSTMDGEVEVYAKACGVNWDKTLVSWNGAELDPIELVDQSVEICL